MKRLPELDKAEQGAITEVEIIEALKHTSPYKVQGPDSIHNQMLKYGGQPLIDSLSLVILFDWSFKIGHFPKNVEKCKYCPNSKT